MPEVSKVVEAMFHQNVKINRQAVGVQKLFQLVAWHWTRTFTFPILAVGLGGELLAGGFASDGMSCGLLSTNLITMAVKR